MGNNLRAWYRGINPFTRLTMDESFALISLMDGHFLTDAELKTSQRLQRKACGITKPEGATHEKNYKSIQTQQQRKPSGL